MVTAPTPFVSAHAVKIIDGVVILTTLSGGEAIEHALSIKALGQLRDRINAALDRYGRGEQDIIES